MLLRDTPEGIEVLMTRRSPNASFAPGAYVFPGGVVDEEDRSTHAQSLARIRPDQQGELVARSIAAVRESFEELGVLLAWAPDGLATPEQIAELDRNAPLLPAVESRGWSLAVDRIDLFCRWITDRDLPRRFDAWFSVARMPEAQQPAADEGETFEPTWIRPAVALERYERRDFKIIFPTIRTLRSLARFASVDEVIAHCRAQDSLPTSCPRGGKLGQHIERFMENEPPFGELELVCPDGQIEHSLEWQHEQIVPLLRNVARLTAPNGSPLTGPGTNSYVVGEPGAYAVIDPGPDIPEHIDRLAAMVGTDLRWILCTHSHPDHSPGAARLHRLTGATVAGLPSGPEAPREWLFRPEHVISDGERFAIGDSTLRAVHTPGHASNHVCFVLEEDRLLFSGDHVLNGSTSMISPPDGDMHAYVEALRRLHNEPVDFILPAHGHVLGPAREAIQRLIEHRLAREAKVVGALAALSPQMPDGIVDMDRLVLAVYDDTPARMHRYARSSLLAHLLKLEVEGKATAEGEGWRLA